MTVRSTAGEPLLDVRDLHVTFLRRGRRPVLAVDGIDLVVRPGQSVGLVGESGSGKSVTALAVMGLLPRRRNVAIAGSVRFGGRELFGLPASQLRSLRGREMAMIFQDPLSSLNPVLTVGRQITEVLERHTELRGEAANGEATRLLESVGIPDRARRLRSYPHQLSGGMRQRVMIAMALACQPRLLIADEPTTALDVTIQAQILDLLRRLVVDSDTALVIITHDLGVVAGMCDTVHVLYAGRMVESAARHELFARPQHPYTAGLLASVPRLDAPRGQPLHPISGSPRDTIAWSTGCAFSPRCPRRIDGCVGQPPPLTAGDSGHARRCVNPIPVVSEWEGAPR
ncbi:MAG: ABC transporter ATP-binding protein [Actinomycetota bacterium]|nr:ABC transporter ATP-binding protein [Actinomycetota bacterium]